MISPRLSSTLGDLGIETHKRELEEHERKKREASETKEDDDADRRTDESRDS